MSGQFPSKELQPGMPAHLWKKGQSGNPTGQSKVLKEVRKLCQALCPEAIERLWVIAKSEDHRAAIVAIKEILVRGIGKELDHAQLEELSKDRDATHGRIPDIDPRMLTDEQIERIDAILKETAL